ncbi:polysaccharide deacetylase family protein [Terrimonas rubra]|uniref:Polysaccharide deacetylase family protein n=1 Tax=Terrimonas rubra TaxID=1035890 RepID=A0ABW6A1A4_9BACT
MLKFRLTIIILSVCLLAAVMYGVLNNWLYFWPLLAAILVIGSTVLFYGSYYINSGFYVKVVSSAETDKKQIAISFDDGPSPDFTPRVLAILQEKNVPAAFFCIGRQVELYPRILQQVHEQGHIIGNHSYSHGKLFDLLGTEKMYHDLQQMNAVTRQAIGVTPLLFRPPYGVTNPNLAKAIKRSGFVTVGWNIRSLDTITGDADKLLQRVLKQVKPGAVVLFHDTCAVTVTMLPVFIDTLKAQGYAIVPLHKMLNLQPYA